MSIFSLTRDLEDLENTSSFPANLRLANRIFRTAWAMRVEATEENDVAILAILERLCLSHPHPAPVIREVCYLLNENIRGIEQNLERRFMYLNWGAELMDGGCIYMLAVAYHVGQGTPVNEQEAIRNYSYLYYGHADCPEQVRSRAGISLAGLLSSDDGSNQENQEHQERVQEAIRIYDDLRRFETDGVRAALHMGALLRTDWHGVAADPVRAWNVYSEAIRFQDIGEVLYELGTMAEIGEGLISPDLRLASYFYERAILYGYDQAEDNLVNVRAQLELEEHN